MRKAIYLLIASLTASVAIVVTAYAQSIPYVRIESKYTPQVASVDLSQFSVSAKSSAYTAEWVSNPDPGKYKEGDKFTVTVTLSALGDNDFKDIKLASCKMDGETATGMALSDDAGKLILTFEKTPLPVILESPQDLVLSKEALASWNPVENADMYFVTLQKMTDKGQRRKVETFETSTSSIDLYDYVYGTPGDYLYTVSSKSGIYWRYQSEEALLPLSDSVLTTREIVGADLDSLREDGTVYEGSEMVRNREYKIAGKYYHFGDDGQREGGWIQDGNGWKYYDPVSLARARGLTKIDGETYFFAEDIGYMQTGLVPVGKDKTMFFSKSGRAVFGWVKHNGKIYFVNKDGSLNKQQLIDKNGKTYLFNEDGSLVR